MPLSSGVSRSFGTYCLCPSGAPLDPYTLAQGNHLKSNDHPQTKSSESPWIQGSSYLSWDGFRASAPDSWLRGLLWGWGRVTCKPPPEKLKPAFPDSRFLLCLFTPSLFASLQFPSGPPPCPPRQSSQVRAGKLHPFPASRGQGWKPATKYYVLLQLPSGDLGSWMVVLMFQIQRFSSCIVLGTAVLGGSEALRPREKTYPLYLLEFQGATDPLLDPKVSGHLNAAGEI